MNDLITILSDRTPKLNFNLNEGIELNLKKTLHIGAPVGICMILPIWFSFLLLMALLISLFLISWVMSFLGFFPLMNYHISDNVVFIFLALLLIVVYYLTISKQFNLYKEDVIQHSVRLTILAYKTHLYEANKQLNSKQFAELLINEMNDVEYDHSMVVLNKKNIKKE